jgi:O-antigen/teichoic acid export membrane protein
VAPFVSLTVIPLALSRIRPSGEVNVPALDAAGEGPAHAQLESAATDVTFRGGSGFAMSVVGIMLAEQTLLNAGVLIIAASTGGSITSGLTGFVFNVLLIVRAPLQLFQAAQTAILPHLAGLEARESGQEFHHAIRITVLAIAAFAGTVALGLLAVGPPVMTALLGDKGFTYGRFGLALVGLGMGFHLVSGTLNQAALARGRSAQAAAAWLVSAVAFVAFVAAPTIAGQVTRVEVGYCGATVLLCALLWWLYRQGGVVSAPAPGQQPGPAQN